MILITFLCQLISISVSNRKNNLFSWERYTVNLDSIFKEEKENNYSFESKNKGFELDSSSLNLYTVKDNIQWVTIIFNIWSTHWNNKGKGINQYWKILWFRIISNSWLSDSGVGSVTTMVS